MLKPAHATYLALLVAIAPALPAQTATQNDSSARAATRTSTLPLINTRNLKFTTGEGSWMSVDLSPDGRTIVFDLLGDLYTLPIAGGTATRITSGAGWDQQPRFSPDGRQIVFVSDRSGSKNLWVANADGTRPKAMTRTERLNFTSPIWSADGQYVISSRGSQLWMYHRDGGSGLQLTGLRADGAAPTSPAPPPHIGAALADDSRYLWVNVSGNVSSSMLTVAHDPTEAIMHEASLRSSARRQSNYQIAQFDRETGKTYVRTHELEGAFRPLPSPDGKWLVYATRHDNRSALKAKELATGEERWLVLDVQRDDHQGGGNNDRDVYLGSAWTRDSRAIITSYGGKIWRVEVPSGRATMIPFTAEVNQDIGALAKFDYPINDSTLTVTQIRGAKPSPDGRRVVFTAINGLYIADLPASRGGKGAEKIMLRNARRLATGEYVVHAPIWSPDGRHVAFVTWHDSIGGDIYRIAIDGGQPERLTRTSAFYDKIVYSPDGRRIVGVRGSKMHRMRTLEDFGSHSGNAELEYVWLPATGGETERIAWVGSGATQQGRNVPHFGPDTGRVYVWAGSEGLVSMRWDGTDRKAVVKVTGPPPPPSATPSPTPAQAPPPEEVLLSPDGTRAIVRANRNVYLIMVPPVSGTAPTISVMGGSLPASRLTRVGGDFIGWSNDGGSAFYSIGRSFFRYDMRMADSLMRDSLSRADSVAATGRGGAAPGAAAPAAGDSSRRGPVYEAQRYDVEITVPKDKPRGTVVLRGARIVTMKGDDVIQNGDVVVKDNRIIGVGPRGSVTIPAGARTIDVAGKTIIPGFVDIHAHTWVAWGVHRTQVSQFMAQLAYGVTTQRDPQTSSEDILAYTDLMELGGLIGPRLYSTGPGIFGADNIRSLDDARDVLRRYSDHYNTQTIKQYMAGDRKVRQWVIMAARELGLTTTTEGGSNTSMNMTLMQDGYPGLEHSLPIAPLYQDVHKLLAVSGITYTPTLIVSYGGPSGFGYWLTRHDVDKDQKLRYFTPHDELDKWKTTGWNREDQYIFPAHAEQLSKMVTAGGRIGLGSHGELQGLGTHWELWMMASGGMKNHEALRAATLHSADAIGLAKDVGSIEVGKLADLQVLDGNPLTDLKNTNTIRYVMKNGRLYEGATLNEVWPTARKLPTMWWWRVEPAGPALQAGRPGSK